jgi:ubiquinone/menaquinone biosynthesis C-methylase UbiE
MKKLLHIITPLHKSTNRDYIGRMMDEKSFCMKRAKLFEFDYWDGDRRFGFGGYHYDGRWKVVAQKLIKQYNLTNKSRILDVGCGEAHLLYELKLLLPKCEIVGFDVSKYALSHAPKEIKQYLYRDKAENKYRYTDKYFDLVISINSLHNLEIFDLAKAFSEIQRVGKNKYIVVEAFRDEKELFNLECWALTAVDFYSKKAWIWLFDHFGYTGDYEFIYFE